MDKIINNCRKTMVNCELTTCIHNSSCCIVPCETRCEMCCNCEKILIKEDEYTGDLQCNQWQWGSKPTQCVECQLYENGEVIIPTNSIKFDIVDEDSF